ncbi:hypothetical protein OJF2_02780 [Aquisphaera giovannonii]|uniref:Beta-propeller repeat protein n=1 Tax=Aquisphaera giovannonii TaxID=406548 RepID=A0A5B9VTX2_9BACT|nr:hypothetical protein [Aquisphaera giovannonii]QEH31813.1 hypothetical protein OJF2_02780 [Aquisphaera giovannonii]
MSPFPIQREDGRRVRRSRARRRRPPRPRLERLEGRALLSAGSLDPTFGQGGSATTDFPLNPALAQGTGGVVDSSGRLVVAGLVTDADNNWATVLARYTRNGSLDPTFGRGGRIVTPIVARGVIYGAARPGVALDARGDILVTGPLSEPPQVSNGPVNDFAVARYTPGGRLDATFGDGGIARINVGYTFNSIARQTNDAPSGIAIQPDGKIVVSGTTSGTPFPYDGGYEFAVARFNADGSVDTGFGADGRAVAAPGGGPYIDDYAYDLALAPDGKIVVAGATAYGTYTAARFTSTGELDPGFASGGLYVGGSSESYTSPTVTPVVVQADNKVILGETIAGDFALVRLDADGTPDPSFGVAGVVTTALSTPSLETDLALQPDGKILAVGWNSGGTASPQAGFVLARYSGIDGAPDPTFGTGGVVISAPPTAQDHAQAVAIQPDGKILLVGYAPTPSAGSPDATGVEVARLDARGNLDTRYAIGGRATATFNGSRYDTASDVAVLPGGLVLVAGTTSSGSAYLGGGEFGLAEYLPDGSLNPLFGRGGRVTTRFGAPGDNDTVSAMAVLPGGKIVVFGTTEHLDPSTYATTYKYAVAQYNPDGSLDRSFGSGGLATIDLGSPNVFALDVAVQPDGKVVLVGSVYPADGNTSVAVVRLTPRGALDPTFGAGGIVTTSLPGSSFDRANAVAIQPDGKILVGGITTDPDYVSEGDLLRYNADGTLDASFGTGGVAILPGTNGAGITSVALQPGGGIVVAASAYQGGDNYYVTVLEVARFTKAGILDPTFGTAGATQILIMPPTDLGGPNWSNASSVVVQPDGKIVVGGNTANLGYPPDYTGTPYTVVLARLTSRGALDPTFGVGGVEATSLLDVTPSYSDVRLALAPDGKVVASYSTLPVIYPGGPNVYIGSDFGVARFLGDRRGGPPWAGLLDALTTLLAQALTKASSAAGTAAAPPSRTAAAATFIASPPVPAAPSIVNQGLRPRPGPGPSLLDEALDSLLGTP